MEQHREGLDYVMKSFTPPSSGRSRISLNRSRSQRSVTYYSGNYEGDSSMFREKVYRLENLNLVDSESDSEQIAVIAAAKAKGHRLETNQLIWRLLEFLLVTLIKPKMSKNALLRLEHFRQSALCHKLKKIVNILTLALAYCVHFALVLSKYFAALVRFCGIVCHNRVRRLLWRLTLAKCSDQLLLFYVLLSLPLLFAFSLIGFIISICGYVKDLFYYGIHTLNKIKLN